MEPNTTTSVHNPLEHEEIDTSTGVKKMVKNIKEGTSEETDTASQVRVQGDSGRTPSVPSE